jgi:ADP-ribosylglycohydrolase
MNRNPDIAGAPQQDRILGGLWGALVGDALGVPVEFIDRDEVRINPVTGMRGFGTHKQPPGTWSDDSSLLLCTADSLVRHEFDTQDLGTRFVRWYREELWTPHGKVFDVGVATAQAIGSIAHGMRAEMAGGQDQYSNGNGSLMRMLPVSLRFAALADKPLLDRVHRASALTHRHPRSQMACGLYTLVIRGLLNGKPAAEALAQALLAFRAFYEGEAWWAAEYDYFQFILAEKLAACSEAEIDSSGYVLHTLTAALWCLLTTRNFQDCVLKAVNLGGDTDTTGCVAGGLAGVAYGVAPIPADWIGQLARKNDVDDLFQEFSHLCVNAMNQR